MKLEDLEIYRLAMKLSEKIWQIVEKWNYFQKDTIGRQWVKASDSIAANISEGFGRYYYKESRQFTYYARGSLYETRTWLTKSHARKLLGDELFQELNHDIDVLGVKVNNYISSLNKLSKK
ncbi:MAG: four helix bundle protein [Thermodesulfobacteriota bacterium]